LNHLALGAGREEEGAGLLHLVELLDFGGGIFRDATSQALSLHPTIAPATR